MKIYQITAIAVLSLLLACEKEDVDNEVPNMQIEKPVTESEYHPGDTIHFEALFTDNEQLKSYKIDIHWAGDHEHKSATLVNSAWEYEKTWDFEAGLNSAEVSHSEIIIPEHVDHDGVEEEIDAGEYHFGVYCTDIAGNQSQEFLDVIVEHDDHDHE